MTTFDTSLGLYFAVFAFFLLPLAFFVLLRLIWNLGSFLRARTAEVEETLYRE